MIVKSNSKSKNLKVCGLVITFYPNSEHQNNILKISRQCEKLIVYDNTDSNNEINFELLEQKKNIIIIRNNENKGISKGLNFGIKFAENNKFDWLATFDQDSNVINDNMISEMLATYNEYKQKYSKDVIIIAPDYIDQSAYYSSKILKSNINIDISEISVLITSGNLINMENINKVGYFDENLFIDFIDNEFCLRAALKNLKILKINRCTMFHSLGKTTQHKLFLLKM